MIDINYPNDILQLWLKKNRHIMNEKIETAKMPLGVPPEDYEHILSIREEIKAAERKQNTTDSGLNTEPS